MDPVIQKAVSGAAAPAGERLKPAGGELESRFNQVLEQQRTGDARMNQAVQEAFGMPAGGNALKVLPAEPMAVNPNLVTTGHGTDIAHILTEVNRSSLQMDQMIEMISTGQSMTPQELLAVQAGVYQIVQEIELTGQVVSSADRARNSLLNIQV